MGEASGEVLSQYHSRFTQGATIVPRVLIIVEDAPQGPLGIAAGQRSVRSNRSALEKAPWRELDSLENVVEERFVRPLLLGSTLLPFRMLEPALAVVPWQGERLLHGDDDELDDYPGLASWWRRAEELWEATAGATTSASSSGRTTTAGFQASSRSRRSEWSTAKQVCALQLLELRTHVQSPTTSSTGQRRRLSMKPDT